MRKVLFVLGQLSDSDMEWIIGVGSRHSVRAGDIVICEGRDIDMVYLVLDGKLSVLERGDLEIARLGCGEIVGEMSFVDGRPPSATVRALTDSVLFAIPRRALASKLEADQGFAARFYRALAVFLSQRLRDTVQHLGYGSGVALEEDVDYSDELNPAVLDTVHLAGARFDRMLKRLMSR